MNTPSRSSAHPVNNILYDAFGAGWVGGSIVALFFLLLDSIQGQPFFTPSLMGTVLFTSTPAESANVVNMGMVAAYTVVHFVAFGILGGVLALLIRQVELRSRHPALMLVTSFLVLEVLFVAAAALLMPGVVAAVGAGKIVAANVLGAIGMASFLLAQHRPDLWYKVKHAVHMA